MSVASLPRHIQQAIKVDESGCWLWQRSLNRDGYGWTSLNDKTYQAHRLVYRLLVREPAEGMVLDHLCRVRHCVNPAHLDEVTNAENLRRGDTPAGWEVCQQCGSEFSMLRGQRRCMPCYRRYEESRRELKALRERERRARMREAS